MFSLIYVLISVSLYKRGTEAMTGFFTRHGMNKAHAERLAWALYIAEYLLLRIGEEAIINRSLPF